MNIRGAYKWIGVLVLLVVAVPILTVVFAADGPFAGLNTLTGTAGKIGGVDSTYQPILAAIVGLVPLGIIAYFAMKVASSRMAQSARRKAKGKSKSRGRPRRRQAAPAMQPVVLNARRR